MRSSERERKNKVLIKWHEGGHCKTPDPILYNRMKKVSCPSLNPWQNRESMYRHRKQEAEVTPKT